MKPTTNPSTLYRGTTVTGLLLALMEHRRKLTFTPDMVNEAGIARQYATEYKDSPALICVLAPSKYDWEESQETFKLEGIITLPDPSIVVLTEGVYMTSYLHANRQIGKLDPTRSEQHVRYILKALFTI